MSTNSCPKSILVAFLVWPNVGLALPIATQITYQGQLKTGGLPVNDSCDLLFSLWNAPVGGTQQGTSFSPNVVVVDGLFQTQIDFGVDPFLGDSLWLEVAVRCPQGGGSFTPLTPRQSLSAVPFSLSTRGIVVDSSENVGIGTSFPANKLTIKSDNVSTLRLVGPTGTFGYGDRLNFGDGEFAFIEEDLDDQLHLRANRFGFSLGRVGVGTLTPAARLDVVTTDETGVRSSNNWIGVQGIHEGDGTFPGVWGETTSTTIGGSGVRGFATAATGGSYGVFGKSSSPSGFGVHAENTSGGTALNVIGNGSFRDRAALRVENTQPNAGMAAYFKSQGTFATMHVENSSSGQVLWLQNDGAGDFIVAWDASRNQSQFWVDKNGKTNVRVLQIHGGADLSERFEVDRPADSLGEDGKAAPGMVVVIDPDKPGKLRVSDAPYDRRVAGVISGAGGVNPGVILGQAGTAADGEHPVALSGRVYCRCDASFGAIQPGDLLTTSPTRGHAMKVTEQERAQGAILGKAMSDLQDGCGLVLVLVTLQ